MDVEQQIGRGNQWTDFARARELLRLARAVERGLVPYAVEV
jgi:hypothetical protein